MSIDVLNRFDGVCPKCGRVHKFTTDVYTGAGALDHLAEAVEKFHITNPYVIADQNTWAAAGEQVRARLEKAEYYVFNKTFLEPDETNLGLAFMYMNSACDGIICIGSGVLNDLCKMVAAISHKPYIIVATAPSMDGYASGNSSTVRDGMKITIESQCPNVIIGDTDILCKAPVKMMLSGLGDMIAKYVSICEWQISALVTGDYYCEDVAELVKVALKRCVDNAEGLLKRDPQAVEAVFEGLVISGASMFYAGSSRPVSGIEHYFSHVWDMRGISLHLPIEFHGIQCAVGALQTLKLYEKLVKITPNREKAMNFTHSFDLPAWHKKLCEFLGKSGEIMVELEKKEGKYDLKRHEKRLDCILENWDRILEIIHRELPSAAYLEELMTKLGMPKTLPEIGVDADLLKMTFKSTKDIRNKYVLSHLCWDLGIIDEIL